MSEKPIASKLQIKENYKVLLINEPKGYRELLGSLPPNSTIVSRTTVPVDLIQIFATSMNELESQLSNLKSLIAQKGLIWVTYPKGTSTVKTDLSRDNIRAYAKTIGLETVALVSIDATWSALRLKKV